MKIIYEQTIQESPTLYSAVSRYFGQSKGRVSNPSGSGINKNGNIIKVRHHPSGDHTDGDTVDLDFAIHSSVTNQVFKYITSLIQDFCEQENIDKDIIMKVLNDRADNESIQLYKDRLEKRAQQYTDKVIDLEKFDELIDKISNNYSNIVTDITNGKTPTLV